MNILQLTNKMPYPAKDGGSIATLNLSKGFVNNGNRVTILSMNTSKHFFEKKDIPTELTDKINFKTVYVETSINFTDALSNLLFSKLPYNAVRFIDDNYKNKLINILKTVDFDIVQLEGIYLAPYIETIKKYSNSKIVLRAHNIEHEIWKRVSVNETNAVKKKYLSVLSGRIKKFEESYINKYDLLVPITVRDLEVFNKMGNKKPAFVSMTGIDTTAIISNTDDVEFPSIFHIGALDWAPNQEGLLWFFNNVWGNLSKKFPNVNIYIAGRNAPQSLIDKINKQPNTVFLGEVEDAYSFMNSKAIMIVPLYSGSGMRIKIIEGMALNKTIVSTKIGAEGIPVENGKNILLANSAQEFSTAIEKLIANRDLFNKIGKNAKKFIVENYDNDTILLNLIDFYNKYI
jgi:glycosyltransferase involved in cell wall biosynthesis